MTKNNVRKTCVNNHSYYNWNNVISTDDLNPENIKIDKKHM